MGRFGMAVALVALMGGVSFGQAGETAQTPGKVQAWLDGLAGDWTVEAPGVTGELALAWAPGKDCLVGHGAYEHDGGHLSDTVVLCWDGVSQDAIALYRVTSAGERFTVQLKIVSETVMEGDSTGPARGREIHEKVRLVRDGADRFAYSGTEVTRAGQGDPNWTAVCTRVKADSDEQTLIALENKLVESMIARNTIALYRIVAEEFTFGTAEGKSLTRDEYFSILEFGGYRITSLTYDDLKVRLYGNAAVVCGVTTEESQYGGKDTGGRYGFTDMWIKRDGQWQCVATHVSKAADTVPGTPAKKNAEGEQDDDK